MNGSKNLFCKSLEAQRRPPKFFLGRRCKRQASAPCTARLVFMISDRRTIDEMIFFNWKLALILLPNIYQGEKVQKKRKSFHCAVELAISASQNNWKDTMMKLLIANTAKMIVPWSISFLPYNENHFQPTNKSATFFSTQKNQLEYYQTIW